MTKLELISQLLQAEVRSRRNSIVIPSLSSSLGRDDHERFVLTRSKSDHYAVATKPRSGIGSLISAAESGLTGPSRSCSCGSFTGKSRSGPLDQVLSQVVGEKDVVGRRVGVGDGDERVDDDRRQLEKLKASLSIQAFTVANLNGHM